MARIVKRYNEDRSLADKPALGHKPIWTLEQMTFINEKMEANDELTAVGKNLIEMITVVRETIYSYQFQFTISRLQKLLYSKLGVHLSTATSNNNDFLKHKQANINVKSRRFGFIVTPFSRQSEQIMRYR